MKTMMIAAAFAAAFAGSAMAQPSRASASTTALTKACGEPTVGDSPTPFAPIGMCGDGVVVDPRPAGDLIRHRTDLSGRGEQRR